MICHLPSGIFFYLHLSTISNLTSSHCFSSDTDSSISVTEEAQNITMAMTTPSLTYENFGRIESQDSHLEVLYSVKTEEDIQKRKYKEKLERASSETTNISSSQSTASQSIASQSTASQSTARKSTGGHSSGNQTQNSNKPFFTKDLLSKVTMPDIHIGNADIALAETASCTRNQTITMKKMDDVRRLVNLENVCVKRKRGLTKKGSKRKRAKYHSKKGEGSSSASTEDEVELNPFLYPKDGLTNPEKALQSRLERSFEMDDHMLQQMLKVLKEDSDSSLKIFSSDADDETDTNDSKKKKSKRKMKNLERNQNLEGTQNVTPEKGSNSDIQILESSPDAKNMMALKRKSSQTLTPEQAKKKRWRHHRLLHEKLGTSSSSSSSEKEEEFEGILKGKDRRKVENKKIKEHYKKQQQLMEKERAKQERRARLEIERNCQENAQMDNQNVDREHTQNYISQRPEGGASLDSEDDFEISKPLLIKPPTKKRYTITSSSSSTDSSSSDVEEIKPEEQGKEKEKDVEIQSDDDDVIITEDQGDSPNKGRRNIRKV